MRQQLVAAALLCACGPGLQDADKVHYRNPKLFDFAAELSQASRKHDVAAVRTLLRDHITIGGLWFEDVGCMTKFAAPARVSGPGLDALARCLTMTNMAQSSRTDALPEVAILTYGAGLEVEARFLETPDGPWLNWIGYVARRDMADALPTVSGATLEALRVEGDGQAPLAGPGAFDELPKGKSAYAWLKVCINGTGEVTGVHVREASTPKAARVFAAAAQTWKFRPFVLRTQPAPVCAMMQMRYPEDPNAKEVLPLPMPEDPAVVTNLPSFSLGPNISGTRLIAPDDMDKWRLKKSGVGRIVGAVHICIDETGRVSRASILRSTGLPGYDRKLVAKVSQWTYNPYLDEGKPVSVCSSVLFIYSQITNERQPGMLKFGDSR